MPITTIAVGVMLAIGAGAVVVATLIVLRPMWTEEQPVGSWTTSLMIGFAVALLGAGAIAVAIRNDHSTTIELGLFLIGGSFGAIGLTVLGIGFFNLAREDDPDVSARPGSV